MLTRSAQTNHRRLALVSRLPLVISLLLVPLSGCAWYKKGPVVGNVIASRELSLSGMEAIQRGQVEQAEILFARAVESNPTDARAHCQFADALWQRGSADKAIRHMSQAVEYSGGDPLLLVQQGEMFLQLGELTRAGKNADRAIAANRQLASAWALKGDVLRARQQLDDALASYHRALHHQEHFPRAQLAAARIYHMTGKPMRTLTTLELLVDQYRPGTEPQEVLYLHGLALKDTGRYSEAIEQLAAANERGRPSADILYHLADAQFRVGDRVNAKLSVQAALNLNPVHRNSQALLTRLSAVAKH